MHSLFMPHGWCMTWNPWLIGLHVVTDAAVSLSYLSIPIALLLMSRQRRVTLTFEPILLLFACFIALCGVGHAMDIVAIWTPIYWVKGFWNLGTAAASVLTAIVVIPRTYDFIRLPNRANELEREASASREQTILLRTVIDAVEEGILLSDSSGKLLLQNRAARELLPPDFTEFTADVPEKPTVWKSPSGQSLERSATDVPGFGRLYVFNDLTERLRREEAVESASREHARQFELLAEAMPVIVWTCRPDGSTDYYNRRWFEITGLTAISPGDWMQVTHPDDIARTREAWESSLASLTPSEVQLRLRCKSRQAWRWHLARSLPVYDAKGLLLKWIGTSTDIDDPIRLSEDLERRVEQRTVDLKASLLEKELLLKELHHRVKNNLQVVCSLLSMQVETGETGDAVRAASLDPIREAYHRVRSIAMVHEHLHQSEKIGHLDFGRYIECLAVDLFQACSVGPPPISLKVSAEAVCIGIGQAVPCGLILNELISNALKHAFPKGAAGAIQITFRLSEPGKAELSISDNGVGLPEGFDITKVRSLGLQVVGALTDDLDGRLRIQSNGGTTIYLNWPLLESPDAQESSGSQNSAADVSIGDFMQLGSSPT